MPSTPEPDRPRRALYGFFGRNGAARHHIKLPVNCFVPTRHGAGIRPRPAAQEVAVKSRLAYVPDMGRLSVMTVRGTLEYLAIVREHWNGTSSRLAETLSTRPEPESSHLSKGQKTQLALIGAICPDRNWLGWTSRPPAGSHRAPRIHRDRHRRVSIRRFGKPDGVRLHASDLGIRGVELTNSPSSSRAANCWTMEADAARDRFRKIAARFAQPPVHNSICRRVECETKRPELEILAERNSEQLLEKLRTLQPRICTANRCRWRKFFVTSAFWKKTNAGNHDKIPFNAETRRREEAQSGGVTTNVFGLRRKRSAPPLWKPSHQSKSGCRCCAPVFASFASAGLHRSPKSLAENYTFSRTSAFSASLR